jgi:hypothetical protein
VAYRTRFISDHSDWWRFLSSNFGLLYTCSVYRSFGFVGCKIIFHFRPFRWMNELLIPLGAVPNFVLRCRGGFVAMCPNGQSNTLPLLSTSGPAYSTRSGYYDPIDRPSDVNSGWGQSTYDRRPSVQSQPVGSCFPLILSLRIYLTFLGIRVSSGILC